MHTFYGRPNLLLCPVLGPDWHWPAVAAAGCPAPQYDRLSGCARGADATFTVTVVPGDGVGPELMTAVKEVFKVCILWWLLFSSLIRRGDVSKGVFHI